MGWEFLIVPIIVVAAWIIQAVVRNAEKAQGPNRAPPRRPERVTDLDRFLREVHRRRQATEERAEEPPQRAERRREPEPRPVRRAPPPQEVVLEVLPVAPAVPPQPVTAARAMTVHEAPPLPDVPSDKSAQALPQRPESAGLVALRRLLRSREGLRTAVVLQEVLGPPLSRRRR